MMSDTFTRLVWKDALLVKTLLLLVAFAVVVINSAIVISDWMSPTGVNDVGAALLFWALIPNLVAFGIPALLIGTEEESGTLAWLRTLPIPRWNVIYSKLLVAILSLAVAWALSTVALGSVSLLNPRLDDVTRPGSWQVADILMPGYFSVLLLFSGFVTSYAFRSPIAALLVVLPFTVISLIAFLFVFDGPMPGRWNDSPVPVAVAIGYLILLLILQHRLALRRLRPAFGAAPDQAGGYSLFSAVQVSAERNASDYRLNLQIRLPIPRLVRAVSGQELLRQPSPTRALLWQAASQQAVPAIVLMLLGVSLTWRWPVWDRGLLAAGAVVAMCWLGSLTFYSDTLRRRHHYFAERGISRSRVWLTRMALPVTAILVIAVVSAWTHRELFADYLLLSIGIVGFAIGSLMSMAAARPVLGLIVSPVLLAIVLALLGAALNPYLPNYWPAVALAAIPILFATWRLLPRWSSGRRGIGFDALVVGYVMLGMLLVCVVIFGHRWATIPTEMPHWRAKMRATEVDQGSGVSEEQWTLEDYHQTRQNFSSLIGRGDLDLQMFGNRAMLDAARRARELIVGDRAPRGMLITVERDEEEALKRLPFSPNWSLEVGHPHLRNNPLEMQYLPPALASLASDELRRQSRRVAIISEWQSYQQQSWRDSKLPGSPYGPKQFLDRPVAAKHANYSLERLRADRFVDAATKATLEYLEHEPGKASEAKIERLKWLWRNVFEEQALPISLKADRSIAELRARAATW